MASRSVTSSVPAPLSPASSGPANRPQEPLLTARQASEFLQVPLSTLAVWRSTGRVQLPFLKVGGHVRYRREDIERFLAGETEAKPAATVTRIRAIRKSSAQTALDLYDATPRPTRAVNLERLEARHIERGALICDGCGIRVEPIEARMVTPEEAPLFKFPDPAKMCCLCAACHWPYE